MNTQKYNSRIISYIMMTDDIVAGANKVMFDLFNNSSNNTPPNDLLILAMSVTTKQDVAVTGVVAAHFDLFRTSSAGTGGTSTSFNAPASNAINISSFDTYAQNPADLGISARSAPTSGAALGAWLGFVNAFPEETNAGTVLQQFYNILPEGDQIEPIVLHPGEGICVRQGSVASLNSYAFTVVFGRVQQKAYRL